MLRFGLVCLPKLSTSPASPTHTSSTSISILLRSAHRRMGDTVSMAKMLKDLRDEKDVQNNILQETCVHPLCRLRPVLTLLHLHQHDRRLDQPAFPFVVWSCQDPGRRLVSLQPPAFCTLTDAPPAQPQTANMKATSNTEKEFAMGREPTEMSRPATSTRSGVRAAVYDSGSP